VRRGLADGITEDIITDLLHELRIRQNRDAAGACRHEAALDHAPLKRLPRGALIWREPLQADPARINFSHGAAWNALIKRYIVAIPFSGHACPAECSISAGS